MKSSHLQCGIVSGVKRNCADIVSGFQLHVTLDSLVRGYEKVTTWNAARLLGFACSTALCYVCLLLVYSS